MDKARKSQHINGDAFVTPHPQSVVVSSRSDHCGTLSSVTFASSQPAPPAVLKKARSTVTAAQLCQAEALQKKKAHNAAFKRATITYDCKRKKDDGMSARAVVDLIRVHTGVELCVRTIQKKVKEGEIGCSPLRRGLKGNIPECHYNNLLMAFESFVRINQINGNVATPNDRGKSSCNHSTR